MRTPAGVECRYYYADFYRGRDHQECRLVGQSRDSEPWTPDLCGKCPVPGILRANGCRDLLLEARVVKRFGLMRRLQVTAYCTYKLCDVTEPMVGCGECHRNRPPAGFLGPE